MDINEFDFTKYQERLQKIVAEVLSGVSSDHIKSELDVKNPEEIKKYLHETILLSLNSMWELNLIWSDYSVTEKLAQLRELKKTSTGPAWRPTTGKAMINPVIMECLKHEKTELQKEIASVREKSEELKAYLRKGYEETQQQIKEIEAVNLRDKD